MIWSVKGEPITGIGGGRYRLTPLMFYFETGLVTLKAQQVPTIDLHDIDVLQSMTQKARGVGDIVLTAVRPTGSERVVLSDIRDFRNGAKYLNDASHKVRMEWQQRKQQQTITHIGAPTSKPDAAPSLVTDLNSELDRLAAHHSSGVLTDEQFTAAKRKLLGI